VTLWGVHAQGPDDLPVVALVPIADVHRLSKLERLADEFIGVETAGEPSPPSPLDQF